MGSGVGGSLRGWGTRGEGGGEAAFGVGRAIKIGEFCLLLLEAFPVLSFRSSGILGSEPQVSGALAVAQPGGKDRAGVPGVSRVASGRARARPGPDAGVCRERLAGVSRCPQPENVTVCHRCYL